jgi:hypothetical protein
MSPPSVPLPDVAASAPDDRGALASSPDSDRPPPELDPELDPDEPELVDALPPDEDDGPGLFVESSPLGFP